MLAHIHWLIFLYAGFETYNQYLEYTEEIERISQSKGTTNQQIERHTKEQQDTDAFRKQIEEAKKTISKIHNEIDILKKRLPANVSEDKDIQSFQSMAKDLNMQDISVEPQEDIVNEHHIIKQYEFKARATYLQFLLLFEKISNLQRIFNIQSLRLEPPEEESRGRFQLVNGRSLITSYQYKVKTDNNQESTE